MAVPVKNYEPIQITQGDTLSWQRSLGDYPASQGWQLKYEIRGGPNAQVIEFSSTPNGDTHQISVAAAVTVAWLPGEYQMQGYAENAGQRERIYLNDLTIVQNLEGADAGTVIATHAQQMIDLIEGVQLGKFKHDILESDVNLTRIRRLLPEQLRDEYNYWKQIRQTEIKVENSKVGRSNGRNRFSLFTDPNGASIGQFGALPPIFPFGR